MVCKYEWEKPENRKKKKMEKKKLEEKMMMGKDGLRAL